ncbi:MAG: hypothetical protein QOG72_948 [Sphingomonadales bacterium]|jgi:hypothetical protein|nr:hypothetical protein [Sphingomonadales bacterium]
MPKLYPEALLFCILWAALAIYGGLELGWKAGAALTLGLFILIMPTSALILSRTGSFRLERWVRWVILVVAALILLSSLQFAA